MDDRFQERSVQTMPSTRPLPNLTDRNRQIRNLISDSYKTFDIFGKPPEDLGTVLKSFVIALDGIRTEDITTAFQRWLKDSSKMPVPADIRKTAIAIAQDRSEATGQKASGWKPKDNFVQVIREYQPDNRGTILAENQPGSHASPVEMMDTWPGRRLQTSYRSID